MADKPSFWDKCAREYAAKPIKNMDGFNQTAEAVRAHLNKTDKVLEVGCGTGTRALLFAEDVSSITATDISANMIEICKERAAEKEPKNVDFIQTTLDDNDLDVKTFDAVMGFNVLHLVEDLPGTLSKINERLKPGGLLISKTVCLGGGISIWKPMIAIMKAFGKAPYVNFISAQELEEEVKNAGFEIIKAEPHTQKISHFIVAKKV